MGRSDNINNPFEKSIDDEYDYPQEDAPIEDSYSGVLQSVLKNESQPSVEEIKLSLDDLTSNTAMDDMWVSGGKTTYLDIHNRCTGLLSSIVGKLNTETPENDYPTPPDHWKYTDEVREDLYNYVDSRIDKTKIQTPLDRFNCLLNVSDIKKAADPDWETRLINYLVDINCYEYTDECFRVLREMPSKTMEELDKCVRKRYPSELSNIDLRFSWTSSKEKSTEYHSVESLACFLVIFYLNLFIGYTGTSSDTTLDKTEQLTEFKNALNSLYTKILEELSYTKWTWILKSIEIIYGNREYLDTGPQPEAVQDVDTFWNKTLTLNTECIDNLSSENVSELIKIVENRGNNFIPASSIYNKMLDNLQFKLDNKD
jgi:hypothetical protein